MVHRTGILAVVDQWSLEYVLMVQLIIVSFNNLGLRPQISVLNCRPTAFQTTTVFTDSKAVV